MTPDYERMSFAELREYTLTHRHDLEALRHLLQVKGRRQDTHYPLADTPSEQQRQEQAIRHHSFQNLIAQIQHDRAAGQLTQAAQNAAIALDLAEKWQDASAIATALVELAEIAIQQGQFDLAAQQLTRALDQLRTQPAIGDLARAEFRLAQVWQQHGDLSRAEIHRDRAREIYQQLGATKDLDRIETEWHQAP